MNELNGINVVKSVMAANKVKEIRLQLLIEIFTHLDSSDSESDSDEEMPSICTCRSNQILIRKRNYMERIVSNYNEEDFRQTFRLPVQTFEKLYDDVYGLLFKQKHFKGEQIHLQKQLLAVLWFLGTSDSLSSVEERFGIRKDTLLTVIVRIIDFIIQLAPEYMKWPNKDEIANIKADFSRTSKFKECIGAIDGAYVGCVVPKGQLQSYINRKGFTSITLQAICDAKMKFIHCFTGWPSSVEDLRIFHFSDIYLKVQQNPESLFASDEYILGDQAYPILPWCVPPYIKDWEEDNGRDWDDTKELFNEYHASTRQVVERSFALLFGRFRRLKFLDLPNIEWIAKTILVCCALHNLCMNFEENVVDFMQEGEASREQYIIDDYCSEDDEDDIYADQAGIHKRDLLRSQMFNI